jgi:6-pyruvoyltetrahydropterin/6-carboxytetrahydropterin synthase
MRARLTTRFHFEAAHFMANYPEGHPNRAFHGHSFTGEVVLQGDVDPRSGMVMEHETLDRAVKEIVSQLDHRLLNEVPGLEVPTGEHIAKWIYDRLRPHLKSLKEVSVSRETVGIKITYSEDM